MEQLEEQITLFIQHIDKLEQADRVALKRNCGMLLKDADTKAIMIFYTALNGVYISSEKEEILFPIACMHCMWGKDEIKNKMISFPQALRQCIKDPQKGSGIEKRLVKLLDQKWDQDGLLCLNIWRMVNRLKKERFVIDMVSLGQDLYKWNKKNKEVQKNWLKICYGTQKEEKENAD